MEDEVLTIPERQLVDNFFVQYSQTTDIKNLIGIFSICSRFTKDSRYNNTLLHVIALSKHIQLLETSISQEEKVSDLTQNQRNRLLKWRNTLCSEQTSLMKYTSILLNRSSMILQKAGYDSISLPDLNSDANYKALLHAEEKTNEQPTGDLNATNRPANREAV